MTGASDTAGSAPQGVWITELPDHAEGIPLAVKDLFDTAGTRTTYGSRVFAEHVPERTAEAVRRLEAAGYVNAGKAGLHEFAYGITSQNPHWGDVESPVSPGRVAGGSSGGCAAALALGLVDAAIGTDSGGSIRIPAACCAVTGLKPTWDLVPMEGCLPLAPSFDHAGPMARDVAGCAAMMKALVPDVGEHALVALEHVRIGVAWLDRAEPGVRRAVERAAALAHATEAIDLDPPPEIGHSFRREIAETHRDLFAEHAPEYSANVRSKIERCLAVTDDEDAAGRAARDRFRETFDGAMRGFDLLLTPTIPIPAPPLDVDEESIRNRITEFTFPFNALGTPALALPCGEAEPGLAASVQLVGRPGDDAMVLAAGSLLERALAGEAAPAPHSSYCCVREEPKGT